MHSIKNEPLCDLDLQRRSWWSAYCCLLGLALPVIAHAAQPQHNDTKPHQLASGLSLLAITEVQQSSPLSIFTSKHARQLAPASDGTQYLKTIASFSGIRSVGSNGDPVMQGAFCSRLDPHANCGLMLSVCRVPKHAPRSYIAPETVDELAIINGPQTLPRGPGASAGTVLFDREFEHAGKRGSRHNDSVLIGSNGRFYEVFDGAIAGRQGYQRVVDNQVRVDDPRAART